MKNTLLYTVLAVLLTAIFLVPCGNAAALTDPDVMNISFPGYELTTPVRVVVGFT